MIMLATSNEDKGNQLEGFTKLILKQLGYTNIVQSEIGPGGEEIDVAATFEMPSPASAVLVRLVCECKAYKSPVGIPDWLKFLGRILSLESRRQGQVRGCFIALSGVNGNVSGHFDELVQHRTDIEILLPAKIEELALKISGMVPRSAAAKVVASSTDRPLKALDIAFRCDKFYWAALFSDDALLLLSDRAEPVQLAPDDPLLEVLKNSIPYSAYIDVRAEDLWKRQEIAGQKGVVAFLIHSGRHCTEAELRDHMSTVEPTRVDSWVSVLEKHGFVNKKDSALLLYPDGDETQCDYGKIASIYRLLISGWAPLVGLYAQDFPKYIDATLLDWALELQGGLKLTDEQKRTALEFLRISSAALLRAITPIPLLVGHRNGPVHETLEKFDALIFLRILSEALVEDVRNPALVRYFAARHGIIEMEVCSNIKLKGVRTVVHEWSHQERLGLVMSAPADGGQFMTIILRNDLPEPGTPGGVIIPRDLTTVPALPKFSLPNV